MGTTKEVSIDNIRQNYETDDRLRTNQLQNKKYQLENHDEGDKSGRAENKTKLDSFSNLSNIILPKINSMPNGFKVSENKEDVENHRITTVCQPTNLNCQSHLLRKISIVKSFNICDTKGTNVLIRYKTNFSLYLMECFHCKIQFISAQSSSNNDKFDGLGLAIAAHY